MSIREQIAAIADFTRLIPSPSEQMETTRKAVAALPQVKQNRVLMRKMQFARRTSASPCTIDGVEYASLAAAAKAHGIKSNRVFERCRSADSRFAGWIQHGVPKPAPKSKNRAVIVQGVEYPSCRAASAALGCAPSTVKDRCNREVDGWGWAVSGSAKTGENGV